MRYFLILLGLITLSPLSGSDRSYMPPTQRHVTYLEYRGVRYEDFPVRIFSERNGSITLCIRPSYEDYVDIPFEIYIAMDSLPARMYHSVTGNGPQRVEIICDRHFPEWTGAYHRHKPREGGIYFQKLNEREYLISGELELDDPDGEIARFVCLGELLPDVVEVIGITAFSPDIHNSEGMADIDGEEVELRYGFHRKNPDSYRFYILDRFILHDRELGYGIYIDFNGPDIYSGKYTPQKNDQMLRVAFFDRDRTIMAEDYTITVKKRWEQYRIDYRLKLPDGREVRGSYRGTMEQLQI